MRDYKVKSEIHSIFHRGMTHKAISWMNLCISYCTHCETICLLINFVEIDGKASVKIGCIRIRNFYGLLKSSTIYHFAWSHRPLRFIINIEVLAENMCSHPVFSRTNFCKIILHTLLSINIYMYAYEFVQSIDCWNHPPVRRSFCLVLPQFLGENTCQTHVPRRVNALARLLKCLIGRESRQANRYIDFACHRLRKMVLARRIQQQCLVLMGN
jgi:hypothetical protein